MINLYIFNEANKGPLYGIGTYNHELSLAAHQSRINVCIIHLWSNKKQMQTEEANGIKHWFFPAPVSVPQTIDYGTRIEQYYTNIVYLLKLYIEKINDLIFHLNYQQSGKLAEALKEAFDCRIVTAIHHFEWGYLLLGNVTRFKKIVSSNNDDLPEVIDNRVMSIYRSEKNFYEKVDHIICLSKNTQQIIWDDYQIKPDKTTLIYNGLNESTLIADKRALRQQYNIPDSPVILFVGRLHYIKGLMYALRAFRLVLEKLPDCHFIIAGNGSIDMYKQEFEATGKHITLTGLIDRDRLYDLYSIADIGVMPSFHEQCSYVAIEMMMFGIPLIASTSTGLREMVEDGVTGLHIPVEEYPDRVEINSSLLAEKMLYLLQHPQERKRMGQNARKRYELLYSAEVFRQKIFDFYQSVSV